MHELMVKLQPTNNVYVARKDDAKQPDASFDATRTGVTILLGTDNWPTSSTAYAYLSTAQKRV